MNKLLALIVFCVACPAVADQAAEMKLTELMTGMEVSQVGMCDGLRTTLVVYRSNDGRIAHEFIGFSGVRYLVVQEAGDAKTAKKHYFTKQVSGQLVDIQVVLNTTAMDWGVPLAQDGPNFFFFHFFPGDRTSDCELSQPFPPR